MKLSQTRGLAMSHRPEVRDSTMDLVVDLIHDPLVALVETLNMMTSIVITPNQVGTVVVAVVVVVVVAIITM